MEIRNPFAARLQDASTSVAGDPRRDGTDRVEIATYSTRRAGHPVTVVPQATDRQLNYITSLFDERDFSDEPRPKFAARLAFLRDNESAREKLTIAEASNLIDYLDCQSFLAPFDPAAQSDEVPAGRYAYTGIDGYTVFVKVDRPEGRWSGYTFVSQQLSDDFETVPRKFRVAALAAITKQGVKESAIRYGHELGVCAVCGRTLTNEASRAAGIGPKCAAGYGW
jgi:hypothetical protein